MGDFLKKNTVTLLIVLATVVLAGIAIFTAVRLYQLRQTSVAPNAPSSRPAAAGTGQTRCGGACTTTADCYPAQNGGQVTCTNGQCQNAACIGKTIPGANCDCSALNACGSPCSASLGLCQAGSICRFVSGPSCTNVAGPNYCFPTGPTSSSEFTPKDNLPAGWSTTICAGNTPGNANFYVLDASGQNPTAVEVLQACLAANATPTPSPTATPVSSCNLSFALALATATPTPTVTASPTPTPTPVPQCGTSCTTNSDCPSTMTCYVGVCRNPSCSASTSCVCATATPVPTTVVTATPSPIAYVPTATPIPTAAPSLPVSGDTTPTILGLGVGGILLIVGLAIVL